MTREESIELLRTIEVCSFKDKSKKYFPKDVVEALNMAIKSLEKIGHLTDRPCSACEFHSDNGCSKWNCVFEK